MNAEQLLEQTHAIDAISRELGVDRGDRQAGAAALLPQILSGFQQPAAGRGASRRSAAGSAD